MHAIDAAWLVLPARAGGFAVADLGALVAIAGFATSLGLRVFAEMKTPTPRDPSFAAALRYQSP
jgi:hypothetical protein